MADKNVIDKIVSDILSERERQKDLPGSEFDLTNGPNDWVSIAAKYLTEDARCRGVVPSSEAYRNSLIKAAAVIVAALEHVDVMVSKNTLK